MREITVSGNEVQKEKLQPGKYALLICSDTGKGIDAGIINKIFDPYFTTKGLGKGTGLGLSVVYGIVRKCNGTIQVHSQPGEGTTFEIMLPVYSGNDFTAGTVAAKDAPTGSGRILIVDDEEAVLRMEKMMLERMGYSVTSFLDSFKALDHFRNNPGDYDVVISDMNMPLLRGDRLAREISQTRPGMPIIICTGFSDRINEELAHAYGIRALLMKPVLKADLAETLQSVLNDREQAGP